MSDTQNLPRRFKVMGEGIGRLVADLEAVMARPPQGGEPAGNILDVISAHLDRMSETLARLESHFNGVLNDLCYDDHAGDERVNRAVERLGDVLQDYLSSYNQCRRLIACGPDAEARDLLAGMYRHTLLEIRNWMAEFVQTTADPLGARMKRGLPTVGRIDLQLTLSLTPAPEAEKLRAWVRRRSRAISAARRIGFWESVGLTLFGFAVVDWLSGKKH